MLKVNVSKVVILLLIFSSIGAYFYYFDSIVKKEKEFKIPLYLNSNIYCNEFGMAYYRNTINKQEILTPILKQDGLGISCENYKKRINNGTTSH